MALNYAAPSVRSSQPGPYFSSARWVRRLRERIQSAPRVSLIAMTNRQDRRFVMAVACKVAYRDGRHERMGGDIQCREQAVSFRHLAPVLRFQHGHQDF